MAELISITVVLFLASTVLFFMGITRKNLRLFVAAIVFLMLTGIAAVYSFFIGAKKSVDFAKATVKEIFRERTAMEIYTAVLDSPTVSCVEVLHTQDLVIPALDGCIWLEFTTCPTELERIISLRSYNGKRCAVKDTSAYKTSRCAEPTWWHPEQLADSINFLTDRNPTDPDHARFLIFSSDSNHAFFCDFAELK